MKKPIIYRIIGIGLFHAVLYLYVVPFLIYPAFGNNGLTFAVLLAVIVSLAMAVTVKWSRKKGEYDE